jgi:hypothetical protein
MPSHLDEKGFKCFGQNTGENQLKLNTISRESIEFITKLDLLGAKLCHQDSKRFIFDFSILLAFR